MISMAKFSEAIIVFLLPYSVQTNARNGLEPRDMDKDSPKEFGTFGPPECAYFS